MDLRLFADDFLVVIGLLPPGTELYGPPPIVPSRAEVRDYLTQHLELYFNGEKIDISVNKSRVDGITLHVTISIDSKLPPSALQSVRVVTTIFVEQFMNQRNVFHIELPGKKRKSLLFGYYERDVEAKW